MNALIWPDGSGPNILVDDGGDASMMILEGKKWEIEYEKTGALPDPSKAGSEDEAQLLAILKETIPNHRSTQTLPISRKKRTPLPRHQRKRFRNQIQIR